MYTATKKKIRKDEAEVRRRRYMAVIMLILGIMGIGMIALAGMYPSYVEGDYSRVQTEITENKTKDQQAVFLQAKTDSAENTGSLSADAARIPKNEQTAEEILQKNPGGIAGILTGMKQAASGRTKVSRIGTSCEKIIVGDRQIAVKPETVKMDLSDYVSGSVDFFSESSYDLIETPHMMSDEDYYWLLRIVEAEAGEEDVHGRVLVANVILNRQRHKGFPDSVTDVIFQYVNGVPQFSPTYDGSIYTVTVTDQTKEAVRLALTGTDYSDGALFFIMRSAAEKEGVEWFDTDLAWLFKYGVHDFYTYPDEFVSAIPNESI